MVSSGFRIGWMVEVCMCLASLASPQRVAGKVPRKHWKFSLEWGISKVGS